MKKNHLFPILLCLLVLAVGNVRADEEQDLITTLRSDAGVPQKCTACFRLRIVGTTNSVPALAALLNEDRLSHAARNALEVMPYAEAGAALRQALGDTSGLIKAGLIDSLGWRRDPQAVPLLAPLLSDTDVAIAVTAASALGKIDTSAAADALRKALNTSSIQVRVTVAEACLGCADRLQAAEDHDGSEQMYRRVLQSDLPGRLRGAALAGLARHAVGSAELLTALRSKDAQFQVAAAMVVRHLADRTVLEEVASAAPTLSASAQVPLIYALADRGDPVSLKAVTTLCSSDVVSVRTAALMALGSIGDADSVPVLLQAAARGSEGEQRAARRSLVNLPGNEIDDLLKHRIRHAPAREQSEILHALAARHVLNAVPLILDTVDSDNRRVRRASVEALRDLADADDLVALTTLLVEAKAGGRDAVRKMLVSVAHRLEAEAKVSRLIIKGEGTAKGETRGALLLTLGELGCEPALPVLRRALRDEDADIRRAAIVALSQWPNGQPMTDLLRVARESENRTHRVLALRGYIDLTASADMPLAARLKCCRTAMGLAKGPAEKRRVLAVLPRIKTVEALKLSASSLDDAQVRQEAALATVTIAKDIHAGNAEPVSAALKRVVAAQVASNIKEEAQKTLDEIEAVRSYLRNWEVAGPYLAKGKQCTQLFDMPFGPELKDAQVSWRKMPISAAGGHPAYLDLLKELNGGEQRVAYLRTQFESPEQRTTTLEIFSDDGVKAWLNGQVIHANNIMRPLMPEPDRVKVTLKKGVNRLMLKVTQNNMPWGAVVRVKDVKAPEPRLGEGFKLHTINADSRFEAAGVVDVNRDGKLDIFCGGFWYEAPSWKKHFVRAVKEQGDYYYDFANLPVDVDGDGWTDIANAAWHNKLVFWVRNPGEKGGPWDVFEVDTPGNMETAMLADINGDGQPDVLPNIMSQAAWYEFHRDASAPQGVRWEKHPLPQPAAGHGLGSGDISGDGRCDIVAPKGWAEQTADGWQWHAEFDLGHASIPILVHDVDEDGDADIIWGLGHNYGLFWLEQEKQGAKRLWTKHLIDDSWSQPHFLILADLDNDKKDELITGKRYHAHNGKDPGGNDQVCVYYYDFDRSAGTWIRHTMHEGGRVGLGINTEAVDMDGDGDIDVVAPGKSGLYLFENLTN